MGRAANWRHCAALCAFVSKFNSSPAPQGLKRTDPNHLIAETDPCATSGLPEGGQGPLRKPTAHCLNAEFALCSSVCRLCRLRGPNKSPEWEPLDRLSVPNVRLRIYSLEQTLSTSVHLNTRCQHKNQVYGPMDSPSFHNSIAGGDLAVALRA